MTSLSGTTSQQPDARRVVITGMGAVTPLGLDLATTWAGLTAGRSGIGPITLVDSSDLDVKIAGEVKGFDPLRYFDRKEARRLDRFLQLGLAAGHQALDDSGLTIDDSNAEQVGVLLGSGIGGLTTMVEQIEVLLSRGPDRVSPFTIPMFLPDMLSGLLSIRTGAKGPNYAVSSACATSGHALGEGMEIIRRGDADVMIAGGCESAITRLTMAAFDSMRALSRQNAQPEKASRPFDAGRDGFVLGEGAGAVVLESLEHARRRGARIHAELVGYGLSGDAYHMTAPSEGGEGAARAMRMAFRKGRIDPSEIRYVNAHATSTPAGDVSEARAVRSVFGGNAPPVSSTKSMTGHLLGAAGVVEAMICVKVIQDGCLPPTINVEALDPEVQLDVVPNASRCASVDTAMSNSFGFGGHNTALILRRFAE
ncbi:MAG: beta-ketoacyl-ACP synthase II [Chloroflexi bacterium]|nr:beta-ketoacyl-ACP synthase II [Chloroflexota bacterium]